MDTVDTHVPAIIRDLDLEAVKQGSTADRERDEWRTAAPADDWVPLLSQPGHVRRFDPPPVPPRGGR